jgi:predicted TIM-barrel enzyme
MPQFLAELKAMGFSGVQNFPTIGLFDGQMRQSFEETGMGYGLEVDMIAAAHELDLLTTPYVFNPTRRVAMTARAPTSSSRTWASRPAAAIGATSAKSLDQCVTEIDAIAAAARVGARGRHRALPRRPDLDARGCRLRPGPRRPACHGFYGAKSMTAKG